MIVYEGEKDMKKEYVRPMMVGERFAPNEYVAACGDENKVYKFKCDAVSGSWFQDGGSVYLETNGEAGLQRYDNPFTGIGRDDYRSQCHPCNETHEAKMTDEFKKGYLYTPTGGTVEVIVWTGLKDDNTHCTTNLNMDSWTTAKS